MGSVYISSKPKKALHYYQKALHIREEIFGVNHHVTAMTYSNIGSVHKSMGNPQKALFFYEKDMAICENHYDIEHPMTAVAYNNIGGAYVDLFQFNIAL